MEIPLEIKIIVTILCAAAVFSLAARELVGQWLLSLGRYLIRSVLVKPKQVAKGFVRNGIHVFRPKARQPV